jgi:hypothetical protein
MPHFRQWVLRVLAASVALALSACSRIADLVLLNVTSSPLVVILTPERDFASDRCPEGFYYQDFATATAVDGQLAGTRWTPLDSTALHCDTSGRRPNLTIALTLPPQGAVRVGYVLMHGACGRIGEVVPLTVEIIQGSRREQYAGDQLLKAVTKKTCPRWVYEIGAHAAV